MSSSRELNLTRNYMLVSVFSSYVIFFVLVLFVPVVGLRIATGPARQKKAEKMGLFSRQNQFPVDGRVRSLVIYLFYCVN